MVNRIVSQRGSTRVVIVGILVAVLIGAGGVFLWWSSEDRGGTTETAVTEVQAEDKERKASKDDQLSSQLKLNEWNISFTIPAALTSTEIKYEAKDTDTFVFTTNRIKALGGECAKSPFGDTVSLTRFSEKPLAIPDGELLNESPINNYYYVLSGPIAYCSSQNSQQINPIESSDRDALKITLKTLSSL